MSQENVELVRAGYEHFLATGVLLREIIAEDFVWDMSTFGGWPAIRAVARQSMSRMLSPSRNSRFPRYSNDSPFLDAIATPPG